jgi:hypothetical protein
MATSRISGLGGLSATAAWGEQPRLRQAIAWLRLSAGSSAMPTRSGRKTAPVRERCSSLDDSIGVGGDLWKFVIAEVLS